MGKIKLKGKAGAATNYIKRNQALKKLQLSLADFRRICILKGIYPREPKNKKKANKGSTAPTTLYYTKDIQYLAHEPVLKKFREHKSFVKKLNRALGKQQLSIAKSLEKNKPVYTLDHIIKERYPTFTDALRDLDDALCMLFLFATLPSTDKIKSETVANCQRLSLEFLHYVIRSHSLRKVFLSIKGIYYQIEIKGQTITWLVPYQFSQQVPDDVDFRVMLTFLEFYQTFVGFVNFKLYTDMNLVYPPKLDISKDDGAAGLNAIIIEVTNFSLATSQVNADKQLEGGALSLEKSSQTINSEERLKTLPKKLAEIKNKDEHAASEITPDSVDNAETEEALMDDFMDQTPVPPTSQEQDVLMQTFTYRDIHSASVALSEFENLFSKCIFYLSREVPRYSLEFIIRAFGGQVGWDATLGVGSPFTESDERITHHIIDRPIIKNQFLARVYVQPQWVYDCINARKLLKTKQYRPGHELPPHMSPFVEHKEGDYEPEMENDFEGMVEETSARSKEQHNQAENDDKDNDADVNEDGSDDDEDDDDDDIDSDDSVNEEEPAVPVLDHDSDYVENETDNEDMVYQMELEAEAAGTPFAKYKENKAKQISDGKFNNSSSSKPRAESGKKRTSKEIEEQEIKELAKIMMTKKQKRLYSKMQYGKKKQEEKVLNLKRKREEINQQKKNAVPISVKDGKKRK
ncbi:Pescadillo N-terminus-domain-containing protein [Gigaspora rosea]|uniref:Pescadillo homolog n=1 Tax=Gigaspora rosea TaxID=44941 RepID=A0A397UWA5_9GLOM|nr:Pescadillo N-terminus-domain-containing protein [Gigaspora rosea]